MTSRIGRRRWLASVAAAAGLTATGRVLAAGVDADGGGAFAAGFLNDIDPSLRLAATWEERRDGAARFAAGLLRPSGDGRLAVAGRVVMPGRAHGVVAERDGRLLVVARRPGDWLARIDPAGARAPQWIWADGETVFNGHVLTSRDGRRVFTTETDLQTGDGLIGVRDAVTLQAREHWPVGGRDPHEIVHGPDGALWVAVGGIEVRPETGRARHGLERMASSLLRIDPADGRETGRWNLPDARLGLRHLAVSAGGRVGIALQSEHADPAQRARAPVLAVWDAASGLRAIPLAADDAVEGLQGYGGSIVALGEDFVISCPRVGRAVRYRAAEAGRSQVVRAAGHWLDPVLIDEICPLAVVGRRAAIDTGPALWAGGVGLASRVEEGRETSLRVDRDVRLDNHWTIPG